MIASAEKAFLSLVKECLLADGEVGAQLLAFLFVELTSCALCHFPSLFGDVHSDFVGALNLLELDGRLVGLFTDVFEIGPDVPD